MRIIVAVASILLLSQQVGAAPSRVLCERQGLCAMVLIARDADANQIGTTVDVNVNVLGVSQMLVLVDFPAPEGGGTYGILGVGPDKIVGGPPVFASADCTGDVLIQSAVLIFPFARPTAQDSVTGEVWLALDEEPRIVDGIKSFKANGECQQADIQSVTVKTGALVETDFYTRFPLPYSIDVAP